MKTTNIILFVVFLLSCGQTARQDKKAHVKSDSIATGDMEKRPAKESRQEQEDSFRLDRALKDAFKIAETAFGTNNFIKQYKMQPAGSSYAINVEIVIGKLFSNDKEYFLLRRHVPWATYLDLYMLVDDKPEKLIERLQHGMTYVSDTIFDANGDGYKDFLVHWYPLSGCCKRDIYNVYLNQAGKGKFTTDYEFVNPTFSAKEQVVRGVTYGHPGEVGLYKYKWNGLQVDTIEFIYPDALVTGQFIKTRKRAHRPTQGEGVVLKVVPKGYHSIESYSWFAEF